jgi:hypothetical protein
VPREPGNEGNQRRLVHIAPSKVLSTSKVVEFVSKDAIARGGEEVDEKFDRREIKDDRRA